MKKLLTTLTLVLALIVGGAGDTEAKEGPATYFISASGTTVTGNGFDLGDVTGTFRFGVKTKLSDTYRLITTYRQIRFGAEGDAKSLQVGGEKIYDLGYKDGFLKESFLVLRGAFDFELNQANNDVNADLGIGWLKPLGTQGVFTIEPFIDMTFKDETDYFTVGFSLNITPPAL